MTRHPATTALCLIFVAFLTTRPSARVSQTPGPPAAADVVKAAVARAAREDKTVLIEFGASWCTWCRAFEAFVKAPDTGPIIAANYVVVNLTVHERDGKEGLENPGGAALMDTWNGGTSGLPFYVFVDRSGRKVADSNALPNGGNIGFPAVPAEITAFMTLIDKTAPRLSTADRATLSGYLARVMPKPAA